MAKHTRKWTRRPRSTAYHEAGHAVVAVVMRIPVETVTAFPDFTDMTAGCTSLRKGSVESLDYCHGTRKHAAFATHCMAGVMAATLWRNGRAATLEEIRKEHGDWNQIGGAALSIVGPGGDATAFYRRGLRRAERILRAHWPAVERVAAELYERATIPAAPKTLSGRQLRRLVRES